MSFGDIFTSGVYSDPYAGAAFTKAKENTRATRLDISRAFTEWRKANPEATGEDVRVFLEMATGGDTTMAPSSLSSSGFLQRLETQSAEAKAKRIREEQEQKVIEDLKWQEAIQREFEQQLEANAFNPEAAWNQTQAKILGSVTDAEARKVYEQRLSAFNPKGHADGLQTRFLSQNLGAMQTIAQQAYMMGDDDKTVLGKLNSWSGRPLDPGNQTVGLVLGEAKRQAAAKKEEENLLAQRREREEQERLLTEQKRDQELAAAIAQLKANGVTDEQIAQMPMFGPHAERLKDAVRTAQASMWEVNLTGAMATAKDQALDMRKTQLAEMAVEDTAKAWAKDRPTSALVLRQIAGNYALSQTQRQALLSVLTAKDAKNKSYEALMKDATRAIGSTLQFDEVAQTQIKARFDSQKPMDFATALAREDRDHADKFKQMQTHLQSVLASGRDELIEQNLGVLEAGLTSLLNGGIERDYNEVRGNLYGDVRDTAALSAAVQRQRQQAQQLLDQVRAARESATAKQAKQRRGQAQHQADQAGVISNMLQGLAVQ